MSAQNRQKFLLSPCKLDADNNNLLGQCSQIYAGSRVRRNTPVHSVLASCMPAISHQQIMLLYTVTQRPYALVTWATLTADVEAKLIADPQYLLHESEWNEGDSLWVMSIVSAGPFRPALSYFLDVVPPQYKTIKFFRRNPRTQETRLITWSL